MPEVQAFNALRHTSICRAGLDLRFTSPSYRARMRGGIRLR